MKKKLREAFHDFSEHFGYCPEFPNNIDFDQEIYAKELQKCIEDNFDYTIEKYGTVPTHKSKWPEKFID